MTIDVWEQNSGNNSLDQKDITNIEDIIGYKFPKDFIKIVLEKNGAYFLKQDFEVLTPDGVENKSVSVLLDIKGDEIESIVGMWQTLQDEFNIIREIVPFAMDGGGNLTCFDFSYSEPHVVYWQHDELWPPIKIADNFSNFLSVLS